MIELSNLVKKRLVKMQLNSSATGNFILDAMVAAFKMRVHKDENFHELMLTNGTVAVGCKVCLVYDELWGLQEQNRG